MPQFNGVIPLGVDLTQYEGIPTELLNKQALLSDHNPKRDKKLKVRFFQDSYFMTHETKRMGYPVFEMKDFIEVICDQKNTFVQMIKYHKDGRPFGNVAKWLSRFPRHYEHFKKQKQEGFPLERFPDMPLHYVETLKSMGVRTLESFVNTTGQLFEKIPELLPVQKRAKAFLKNQTQISSQVDIIKVKKAELEAVKKEIEEALARKEEVFSDSSGLTNTQ